jgi:hypothetical protein
MNLDRNAVTQAVFVDSRAKFDDRTHVLVAGSEVLIEWEPTLYPRW